MGLPVGCCASTLTPAPHEFIGVHRLYPRQHPLELTQAGLVGGAALSLGPTTDVADERFREQLVDHSRLP